MLFADVILPLALPQLYTYSVPFELEKNCEVGKRVVIQFGKKKLYSALIRKTHEIKPLTYEVKDIISIIDEKVIISEIHFKFWEWLADYYMCTLGEVFKAAIPAGMKLESETIVYFNDDFKLDNELSEKETIIFNYLKKTKSVQISELNQFLEQKITLNILNSLIEKNIILVEEKLKDKYKPKLEKYIKLSENIEKEEDLKKIFDELSKIPKQLALLTNFTFLTNLNFENPKFQNYEIKKNELLQKSDVTTSVLDGLIKKEIFVAFEKEIGRLHEKNINIQEVNDLSEAQNVALQQIKDYFVENNNVLLFGVTSSGKTEIYIHLINQYLAQGKQILYLLPEIAITSQIINRLKKIFGEKIGVYHSKFSDSERVEIWNNINSKNSVKPPYQIILGVRSSIFLPFNNLGLIIIDEEHENSYKQFDPAPRYNARDAAIVLANFHKAKVLMGTATPSYETYFNCLAEKYKIVELNERHQNIELPEILIADTKEATRKKLMKSIFTPLLLDNIQLALKNNEQVILFQNRRGFSPYIECKICAWIPKCENCDVSLTYHKNSNDLVCHYCGFKMTSPHNCLACGDTSLQTKGFGTEKIEDEIKIFFPNAKISRMDHDTTKSRKSYEKIISDFEQQTVDILIGTQMISKGLDFENVSVVGIMNADSLLNFPDFRAYERSFQMMIQVSGRAGRKNKRGKVIIQTANPDNVVIKHVINNNYLSLVKSQFIERKNFKYPPYYKLIKITVKHKDIKKTDKAAEILTNYLKKIFADRVLGPEFPLINRIQNWYMKDILIKIEKQKSLSAAREIIVTATSRLKAVSEFSNIQININVDPM